MHDTRTFAKTHPFTFEKKSWQTLALGIAAEILFKIN